MKWILFFLFPTLVFAFRDTPPEECRPLDLRNESLGKVRNQQKVSWCYAFTAADVLDYSYEFRDKISAADLAIQYNTTLPARVVDIFTQHGPPHQTGFALVTLMKGIKEGVCPERVFSSESWTKVTQEEKPTPLDVAFKDILNLIQRKGQLSLENLPFYYRFKNVGKEEFFKLIKTSSPRNFYTKLAQVVCQNDRQKLPHDLQGKMVMKRNNIFSSINSQLSRGNLVSIDYDIRILADRQNRAIGVDTLHTSSLVGRRWNQEKKSCEYMIRNSYGEECSGYDSSYQCEKGHVWLTEKEIYPSLVSIVYLILNENEKI